MNALLQPKKIGTQTHWNFNTISENRLKLAIYVINSFAVFTYLNI